MSGPERVQWARGPSGRACRVGRRCAWGRTTATLLACWVFAVAGIESAARAGQPQRAAGRRVELRRLFGQMRRQARAGAGTAAVQTARQIAGLLDDDRDRLRVERATGRAKSQLDAGQTVDFDSLIELIQSVIAPDSWSTVGGPGAIEPFPGGVYVDADGVLRRRVVEDPELTGLAQRAGRAAAAVRRTGRPAISAASLRMISLRRLERQVAQRLQAGRQLSEDMRFLAGLLRIDYLFVYPEQGEVVVAGPAEPWVRDRWGRAVGRDSGWPVLQLDDLVVVLRACLSESGPGIFGCGIYPRREGLERVQRFVSRSAAAGPIRPAQRDQWLARLRQQLGLQDIRVFGVPAGSRVAHVLIEADYRMKLIGIGLEQAAAGRIPSYFELLGHPDPATLARPLDTLRWWFTLGDEPIRRDTARRAFDLRGCRVQVLSENELLTATGQRVHTGWSDPINTQFARRFTASFPELAAADPCFADLANLFHWSLVAALLRSERIMDRTGWSAAFFRDPDQYLVLLQRRPRTVETVLSHRVYDGRHILAAISGGVHVDPWPAVQQRRLRVVQRWELAEQLASAGPDRRQPRRWWWDAVAIAGAERPAPAADANQ